MPMNNLSNFNYAPQRNQFSSYFNPATGVSTSTNNIVWVQGIEGAKAWQLSPNSMVILLDSEAEGKMYIKVSDNIGMSSLRIFNYTEVLPSENVTINQDLDLSLYVKKDELGKLIKEILNEQTISTVNSEQGGNASSGVPADKYKVISTSK
jgi:hypothetical protein